MRRVLAAAFMLITCLLSPLCGCMVRPSNFGARSSLSAVSPTFRLKRFVSRAPNSVYSVFFADTSMQYSAGQFVMQPNPCWMVCQISLRSALVCTIARSRVKNTF
ncbi:hypothetical protein TRVL_09539 [Trypanosoma vivax]|nr:hypothetical protein TRVL_09539 [Trypanosoma vivax]